LNIKSKLIKCSIQVKGSVVFELMRSGTLWVC